MTKNHVISPRVFEEHKDFDTENTSAETDPKELPSDKRHQNWERGDWDIKNIKAPLLKKWKSQTVWPETAEKSQTSHFWQKHYISSADMDPSGPSWSTQANRGGSELCKLNRGNHERTCSSERKILGTVTSQLSVDNLSDVWINQETH